MAALKTNLGKIPCPECGDLTALKENEAGTLTIACQECDLSAFAKKGSECAKVWRGKLPKAAVSTAENGPAAPVPKAAAKSGFSLGGLGAQK